MRWLGKRFKVKTLHCQAAKISCKSSKLEHTMNKERGKKMRTVKIKMMKSFLRSFPRRRLFYASSAAIMINQNKSNTLRMLQRQAGKSSCRRTIQQILPLQIERKFAVLPGWNGLLSLWNLEITISTVQYFIFDIFPKLGPVCCYGSEVAGTFVILLTS